MNIPVRKFLTIFICFAFIAVSIPAPVLAETIAKKNGEHGVDISQNPENFIGYRGGGMVKSSDGSTITVWSDYVSFGVGENVYGQRIDANGNKVWGEAPKLLIANTTLYWYDMKVASDGAGGVYVAYHGDFDDIPIYVERFDANGNAVWAQPLEAPFPEANQLTHFGFTSDPSGNFVLVGKQRILFGTSDYIQYYKYAPSGTLSDSGTIELVDGDSLSNDALDVFAGSANEFYVTFSEEATGWKTMRLRQLENDWIGGEDGIDVGDWDNYVQNQVSPRIVVGQNILVVVWYNRIESTSEREIRMQIVNRSTGAVLLGDGLIINPDTSISYSVPQLQIDSSDNIYAAWGHDDLGYVQKFNALGVPQWNGGNPVEIEFPAESSYDEILGMVLVGDDLYIHSEREIEDVWNYEQILFQVNASGQIVREFGQTVATFAPGGFSSSSLFPINKLNQMITVSGSNIFLPWTMWSDEDNYYESVRVTVMTPGYQITNLSAGLDARVNDQSVQISTENGAYSTQTTTLHDTAIDVPLASASVVYSSDRNWSTVSGSSDVSGKAFVTGLGSAPGVTGTFSIYVPKITGHAGVRICPDATSLGETTADCANGTDIAEGAAGLSVVTVGSDEYWLVSGLTGTGVISMETVTPPSSSSSSASSSSTSSSSPSSSSTTSTSGGGSGSTSSASGSESTESSESSESSISSESSSFSSQFSTVTSSTTTTTVSGVGQVTNSEPPAVLGVKPDVIVPAVTAVAAVSVVAAASISTSVVGVTNYSAFFLGGIIWRKRKYFGLVYNAETFDPLALVVVRFYKKSLAERIFVGQTVTDMEGRYGFNLPESGEYQVEFTRDGFGSVIKTITIRASQDVALDVGLRSVSLESQGLISQVRYLWKENASTIMQVLRIVLALIMVWGLSLTLGAISVSPTPGNYLIALLYLVFLVIQVWQIASPWFGVKLGMVVESETQRPLPGVIVRILNADKEKAENIETLGISNAGGVIKLRIQDGEYQYAASKQGYDTSTGETEIDESGKLSKFIKLTKSNTEAAVKFGT